MKLNRWTILAVILLVSTAIGLAFRPSGEGAEGRQIVEDRGLSLECPESITVDAGALFLVECVAISSSPWHLSIRAQQHFYDAVSRGWQVEEVDENTYELTELMRGMRSRGLEVRARVGPHTHTLPAVADARATIDLRVRHNLLADVGVGLFLTQAFLLLGSLLLAIISWPRRNSWPKRSSISEQNSDSKLSALRQSLILPWLYLLPRAPRRTVGDRSLQRVYAALGILFLTLMAQVILMTIVHITDSILMDGQTHWIFPPQFTFIFTIPFFAAIFIALLVGNHKMVRARIRHIQLAEISAYSSDQDNDPAMRRKPLLVTLIVGLALLLLAGFLYGPLLPV